ncbi:hypothetical protein JVU11DRAFT_9072 [Chiua virens]|nr:hypothetical protein JVU11DRAFT_9072 [Chiua virens]
MPEYKESLISTKLIQHFLEEELQAEDPDALLVRNLWVDSTGAEASRAPKLSRAAQGHVYILEDTSTILRGQLNSQKPVYPPGFRNQGITIAQRELRLIGAEFSPRNVNLNLAQLWVQIQLFTHVCAQIYTRDQWYNAICVVNKQVL